MKGSASDDQGLLRSHLREELRKGSLDTSGAIVNTLQSVGPRVVTDQVEGFVLGALRGRHSKYVCKNMRKMRDEDSDEVLGLTKAA